jgi:hypothetical protein
MRNKWEAPATHSAAAWQSALRAAMANIINKTSMTFPELSEHQFRNHVAMN